MKKWNITKKRNITINSFVFQYIFLFDIDVNFFIVSCDYTTEIRTIRISPWVVNSYTRTRRIQQDQ